MSSNTHFFQGEYRRKIDERFRLAIPGELAQDVSKNCILAKERPGALSLWRAEDWNDELEDRTKALRSRIEKGRILHDRLDEVQQLGRLLSTRHRKNRDR